MSRIGERCVLQRDALNALARTCGSNGGVATSEDSSSNFQCLSAPGLPTGIRDPASCGASVAALNGALNLFTFGASGDAPFSCSLEGWVKVDNDCSRFVGYLNAAVTSFLDGRDFSDCDITTLTTTPTTTTTRPASKESSGFLFAGGECSFFDEPVLSAQFGTALAGVVEAACFAAEAAPRTTISSGCKVDSSSVDTVCVDGSVAAFFKADVKFSDENVVFSALLQEAVQQGQIIVELQLSRAFSWLPDRDLVAVSSYPAAATLQVGFPFPLNASIPLGANDDLSALLTESSGSFFQYVSSTRSSTFAGETGTGAVISTFVATSATTALGFAQYEESVASLTKASSAGTLSIAMSGVAGPVALAVGAHLDQAGLPLRNTTTQATAADGNSDPVDGSSKKTIQNPALVGGLAGAGGLLLILTGVIAFVLTRSRHHSGASNMYLSDMHASRASTPFGGLPPISEAGYMDVRGRPGFGGPMHQRPSIFGVDAGASHYYPAESAGSEWSVWGGGGGGTSGELPAQFPKKGASSISMASFNMRGSGSGVPGGLWGGGSNGVPMLSDLELATQALAATVSGFEDQ